MKYIKSIEDFINEKYHPGFKKAALDIAKKNGVSKKEASAILASSTRKSSMSAKRKNPKLKKVK
jgi:hypothetical protein